MAALGFRRAIATGIAALCWTTLGGAATAQPAAPLGGGSGILLGEQIACTLTTIGYDRAERLVGLTAGHCARSGTPVRAEQAPQAGVIGTVAVVDEVLDYAVIAFDRERVSPVRQVAATLIIGIGSPPRPGDLVCKNGRTSGHSCGPVQYAHPWWFQNRVCSQPGDSGGPVTVGDRLVGMNVGHFGAQTLGSPVLDVVCRIPAHDPAVAVQIGVVLEAIDRTGGIGSGFRPL